MVLKGSWLWNCSRIELVNTSLCSHLCFWTTGARSSCPWFDPQLLTVNILSKELDVVIFCYCCIERIITLCHSFVTSWFWKEELVVKLFKDRACEMHLCVAISVFGRQVPSRGVLDLIPAIDSEHLESAHDNLSSGYLIFRVLSKAKHVKF